MKYFITIGRCKAVSVNIAVVSMGLIVMLAMSPFWSDSGNGWASGKKHQGYAKRDNACNKTSLAAFRACRNENKADYWITVGKCKTFSEPELSMTCRQEALELNPETGDRVELIEMTRP